MPPQDESQDDHARRSIPSALATEMDRLVQEYRELDRQADHATGFADMHSLDFRIDIVDVRLRSTIASIRAYGRATASDALRSVLSDSTFPSAVRVSAAEALMEVDDERGADLIGHLLTEGHPGLSDDLATAVATHAPPGVGGYLADWLDERAVSEESHMIAALGPDFRSQRNDLRRADAIERFAQARSAAVAALAGYEGPLVDDVLRRAAASRDEAGQRALEVLGPRAGRHVVAATMSSTAFGRDNYVALARGLGLDRGDVSALDAMEPEVRDQVVATMRGAYADARRYEHIAHHRIPLIAIAALTAMGEVHRDDLRSLASRTGNAELARGIVQFLCDEAATEADVDVVDHTLTADPRFRPDLSKMPSGVRQKLAARALERHREAMASVAEIAPFVIGAPASPGEMELTLDEGAGGEPGLISGFIDPAPKDTAPLILGERMEQVKRTMWELGACGTDEAYDALRQVLRDWTISPTDDRVFEDIAYDAAWNLKAGAKGPEDRAIVAEVAANASRLVDQGGYAELDRPDANGAIWARRRAPIEHLADEAAQLLSRIDRDMERSTIEGTSTDALYERVASARDVEPGAPPWVAGSTHERMVEAVAELARRGEPIDGCLLHLAYAGGDAAQLAVGLLADHGEEQALRSLASHEHAPIEVRAVAAGVPMGERCQRAVQDAHVRALLDDPEAPDGNAIQPDAEPLLGRPAGALEVDALEDVVWGRREIDGTLDGPAPGLDHDLGTSSARSDPDEPGGHLEL